MRSSRREIRRHNTFFVRLMVAFAIASVFVAPVFAEDVGGKRAIDVETVNLYIGSDLSPLISLKPTDPPAALIAAATTVHARILASNYPARAAALAQEIVARGPDVVALQEVALIRKQSPGDFVSGGHVAATDVELDFLEILLTALRQYGGHYAVVSHVDNTDIELPVFGISTIDDVRLTDRDVILARTDLPPGQFRVASPHDGHYAVSLPLPIGVNIVRGWCSIDVQMRGRSFRVINTHLEEVQPVQGLQALELLQGPANVNAPVLLLGDLNSDANGNYSPETYAFLTGPAHFSDAWSEVYPHQPGLTWGHDEFLANKNYPFSLRIDLVLSRGAVFDATNVTVVDPIIRSTPPFWFSDHAAVYATIRIH